MIADLSRHASSSTLPLLIASALSLCACAPGTASDLAAPPDAQESPVSPQPLPVPSPSPEPAPPQQAGAEVVDPRRAVLLERADALVATMMLRFWPQLRDQTNDAGYWTYAQDWEVVLDAVDRRGKTAYPGTAVMFYEIQNARGWSRSYYDDESWMVLALLHAYDQQGRPEYLSQAKNLYAHIMAAWDESCCGAHPGGIWWRTDHDAKVTAINAGAVVAGARLFERTRDAGYLTFAKKVYGYWTTYMVDPVSGHVFDNVSASGAINTTWSFTYNEGLMIGAAVALARVEQEPSYLLLAHRVAGYLLKAETAQTPEGLILSDGPCGRPGGDDGEQFKGIAARYLAELYLADPSHTEYRELLVRSAAAAWNLARDPATGLVSCDWAGPYRSGTDSVNSLSSAAMVTAAAARALGPPAPRPGALYEAEEAVLHAVGLEAVYGASSGFGYVAGWKGDGQWVDFLVEVDLAGIYDAELRYASTEDASRRLYVNGETAIPNLAFPTAAADYVSYRTVTAPVALGRGRNTVSVIYDQGQGSQGFLNLDRLELKKR